MYVFGYDPSTIERLIAIGLIGSQLIWWIIQSRGFVLSYGKFFKPSKNNSLPFVSTWMITESVPLFVCIYYLWNGDITGPTVRRWLLDWFVSRNSSLAIKLESDLKLFPSFISNGTLHIGVILLFMTLVFYRSILYPLFVVKNPTRLPLLSPLITTTYNFFAALMICCGLTNISPEQHFSFFSLPMARTFMPFSKYFNLNWIFKGNNDKFQNGAYRYPEDTRASPQNDFWRSRVVSSLFAPLQALDHRSLNLGQESNYFETTFPDGITSPHISKTAFHPSDYVPASLIENSRSHSHNGALFSVLDALRFSKHPALDTNVLIAAFGLTLVVIGFCMHYSSDKYLSNLRRMSQIAPIACSNPLKHKHTKRELRELSEKAVERMSAKERNIANKNKGIANGLHQNLISTRDRKYVLPVGMLFGALKVTSPNYLGEMIQWFGFALICRTLGTTAFAISTILFLSGRAFQQHIWYLQKFGEAYEALERNPLLPGILFLPIPGEYASQKQLVLKDCMNWSFLRSKMFNTAGTYRKHILVDQSDDYTTALPEQSTEVKKSQNDISYNSNEIENKQPVSLKNVNENSIPSHQTYSSQPKRQLINRDVEQIAESYTRSKTLDFDKELNFKAPVWLSPIKLMRSWVLPNRSLSSTSSKGNDLVQSKKQKTDWLTDTITTLRLFLSNSFFSKDAHIDSANVIGSSVESNKRRHRSYASSNAHRRAQDGLETDLNSDSISGVSALFGEDHNFRNSKHDTRDAVWISHENEESDSFLSRQAHRVRNHSRHRGRRSLKHPEQNTNISNTSENLHSRSTLHSLNVSHGKHCPFIDMKDRNHSVKHQHLLHESNHFNDESDNRRENSKNRLQGSTHDSRRQQPIQVSSTKPPNQVTRLQQHSNSGFRQHLVRSSELIPSLSSLSAAQFQHHIYFNTEGQPIFLENLQDKSGLHLKNSTLTENSIMKRKPGRPTKADALEQQHRLYQEKQISNKANSDFYLSKTPHKIDEVASSMAVKSRAQKEVLEALSSLSPDGAIPEDCLSIISTRNPPTNHDNDLRLYHVRHKNMLPQHKSTTLIPSMQDAMLHESANCPLIDCTESGINDDSNKHLRRQNLVHRKDKSKENINNKDMIITSRLSSITTATSKYID